MEEVDHPQHYNKIAGIECIDVIEFLDCNLANAVKYIWRAGEKDKRKEKQDIEKAIWYLDREMTLVRNGFFMQQTLSPVVKEIWSKARDSMSNRYRALSMCSVSIAISMYNSKHPVSITETVIEEKIGFITKHLHAAIDYLEKDIANNL